MFLKIKIMHYLKGLPHSRKLAKVITRYVKETTFMGIELDPIYEGKCVPYISDNDLFWIIGKRR